MLDESTIEISGADIVLDQYDEKPGISCKGRLQRDHADEQISIDEYIRTVEYIGFRFQIDDISPYDYIEFYGKKVNAHGQPSVFLYDNKGTLLAQLKETYRNIDDEWHLYSIDVSNLTGEVVVIFNGSYLDYTGSLDSEYIFSNVFLR